MTKLDQREIVLENKEDLKEEDLFKKWDKDLILHKEHQIMKRKDQLLDFKGKKLNCNKDKDKLNFIFILKI